jgi:hypothetical protein
MRTDCGYDSHLSNNSVAKYSNNFHTGAVGSENMWSVRSLSSPVTCAAGLGLTPQRMLLSVRSSVRPRISLVASV